MLKQRIITAIILMSGLLLALFSLSPSQFNYVLLFILALGAWEWSDLSSLSQNWQRILYSIFVVSVTSLLAINFQFLPIFSGAFTLPISFLDVMGSAGLFWAIALLWVLSYPASNVIWGHSVFRAAIGLFVIVPAILAVMFILSLPQSQWLFLYVLGIVVVADVGAYFTGSRFGGAKLAAAVSPGKSWAGFWGGVVCVLIYSMLIAWCFPQPELSFIALVSISICAAIASVLGDLLESMFKRHRGLKDSSQLLPGHGGILDRLDSITAAAPVFVLLLILLSSGS